MTLDDPNRRARRGATRRWVTAAIVVAALIAGPLALKFAGFRTRDSPIVLGQWTAIVDASLADRIRAVGTALPAAAGSGDYSGYALSTERLLELLRPGLDEDAFPWLDGKMAWVVFESNFFDEIDLIPGGPTPLRVSHFPSRGGNGLVYANDSGAFRWVWTVILTTWVNNDEPIEGGRRADLSYTATSNYSLWVPPDGSRSARVDAEGRINPTVDFLDDTAIVYLAPFGIQEGRPVELIIAWHGVAIPPDDQPYVKNWADTRQWIEQGPAGVARFAREHRESMARLSPPADGVLKRWTREFEPGRSVTLVALGRPRGDGPIWWDAEGTRIAPETNWNEFAPGRVFNARLSASWGASIGTNNSARSRLEPGWPRLGVLGEFTTQGMSFGTQTEPADAPGDERIGLTLGAGVGAWIDRGEIKLDEPRVVEGRTYHLTRLEAMDAGPNRLRHTGVQMRLDADPDIEVGLFGVSANGEQVRLTDDKILIGRFAPRPPIAGARGGAGLRGDETVEFGPIERILLKTRPRKWVTFTDFPLWPEGMEPNIDNKITPPPVR